ncbi:MAG TPA: chemotaxis response regulator protein-glutamate methylesterase [Pyrinomonadaceae bacterium]|nr:chemotaxis response regulator protein-glutamate methylesterase [Pyrinomonadaceae bacterium]
MIRVLVVDDSAVVRRVISDELSKFEDIEVVGGAIDPFMAREKIAQLRPDVLTLDIEMPRMDGLSFLDKLMKHYPIPVVVVSSLAPENSQNALRALELGAIDIVSKPGSQFSAPNVQKELVRAIRTAARAKVFARKDSVNDKTVKFKPQLETTHKIIAIGASTGGTQAVEKVLTQFPANSPGTIIVQHMPAGFTASFADRLNKVCKIEVREARNGDSVAPGVALVAPGNYHMLLQRSGASYSVVLKNGPAVHFQRPSVDVMFQSVARNAGKNAVGVILTGMGADGATGMLQMHETGAKTIAQDEDSCVVFGMPKEAIKVGAVDEIMPLQQIPQGIFQLLKQ